MPRMSAAFTWAVPSTVIILIQALLIGSSLTSVTADCRVSLWAAAFLPEDIVSAAGTTCTYDPCDDMPWWWPCYTPVTNGYNSGDVRTEPKLGGSARVYTALELDLDARRVSYSWGGVGESKCLNDEEEVLSTKCSNPEFDCDASDFLVYLEEGMRVRLEYTAPNPYNPPGAGLTDRTAIRGDFNLEIRDSSFGRCEEFEYALDGSHSEYPSHEFFIGNELIYFNAATGTPQTNVPQSNIIYWAREGTVRPSDKSVHEYPDYECWDSSDYFFC